MECQRSEVTCCYCALSEVKQVREGFTRRAVNFHDTACGCSYEKVVVPEISKYVNMELVLLFMTQRGESWGDVEKELRGIPTDSAMPATIKEACA